MLNFVISFLSSIAGAICGIGGGVIIKPVLDMFGAESVSAISFLSGCTVLSMSCYSVSKAMLARDSKVDLKTATPLGIGAAVGGVVGKFSFNMLKAMFANPNAVGGVQAICLAVMTLGTLIYTLKKQSICTHRITGIPICLCVGLILGICSSFLGIGGGPINLIVLYYFFSMDTKTAASNSLYIILFSQITSLLSTLLTRTVPEFELISLVLMVAGGILGGAVGRQINKKISNTTVDKLFIFLMAVIIGISVRNAIAFMS